MRKRLDSCHFFSAEEAQELVQEYVNLFVEDGEWFARAEGAAIQYYLSEFLYLPCSLIGDIFDRRPWHVNQTLQRLKEAAGETRTPVTMNDSYRDTIERLDDLSRAHFGARNVELCTVQDEKERAWLLWSAQKACGWFDDNVNEPEQSEVADDLLRSLGLPAGGWMREVILENYRVDYHG